MKKEYTSPEFVIVRVTIDQDVLSGSPLNPIGGEVGSGTGNDGGQGDDGW